MRCLMFILVLFLASLFSVPFSSGTEPTHPNDSCGHAVLEQSFGQFPLYFVENQGQLDGQACYYIQGSDKTLYFTPEGIIFVLTRPKAKSSSNDLLEIGMAANMEMEVPEYERWIVKLDFLDADPVQPKGLDKQKAIFSYFKGKREDWKTGISTYSKIVYKNLWPGVDLVYSGTVNKLKYEFVVKPGGKPDQIRLAYRGVSGLHVNEAGALVIETSFGPMQDEKPFAYQMIQGEQKEVAMNYSVENNFQNEKWFFGFNLGSYNPEQELILDPAILIYCGYIGGTDSESGYDIALDASDCAYITGFTWSPDFPVEVGPDLVYNADCDAFVAKVNAAGDSLIYCGYIGGVGTDHGRGIAVDDNGSAYITGETNSDEGNPPGENFPVFKGPDKTFNGSTDAFVAKVNPLGDDLVYSGYIGGSNYDGGSDIKVDSTYCAYVIGKTKSEEGSGNNFPATVGPDTSYNQGDDVFIAKILADGFEEDTGHPSYPLMNFHYCGYIGGTDSEKGGGIYVDNNNCAYVVGSTTSDAGPDGFPVVVGPYLVFNASDREDVFVAKLKAYPDEGADPFYYCGYIGGESDDESRDIDVDEDGCAYVVGYTLSDDLPVLVGPDLTFNVGTPTDYDGFIAKLKAVPDATSDPLIYCGYVGGTGNDEINGVIVDENKSAYIAGGSSSNDGSFHVKKGPDLTHNGGLDAVIAKLKANPVEADPYDYCGFIGGVNNDHCQSVAVNSVGNAYVTGMTHSDENSFPVLVGPELTYGSGYGDAFVAKIGRYQEWYVDWNAPGPTHDGLSWETAFTKIYEAKGAASDGDTILVAGGTYLENLTVHGKAVMIKAGGKNGTPVIDGRQLGACVSFNGISVTNFGIEGFILTNGSNGGIVTGSTSQTGYPIIKNCVIHNNTSYWGAGIYCGASAPSIINTVIHHNIATGNKAGGIWSDENGLTITNCTIYQNDAGTGPGGGIYFQAGTGISVRNTIIWGNTAASEAQVFVNSGNPSFTYCSIQDGKGEPWFGTGCIEADPLFMTPDNGNFHLNWGSLCIDQGDPDSTGLPEFDIDGNARVSPSGIVDIGADEVIPIHVPGEYSTIQAAINAAAYKNTVVVDQGIYVENIDFTGKAISVQSVYGFRTTIIDGSQSGSVVTFSTGEGLESVLDGFSLINGSATDGGGIYCLDSSPTIINNRLVANVATTNGGGVYLENSSPFLGNDLIEYNSAGDRGGAIYCTISSPIIYNNTIFNNSASVTGGIWHINGSEAVVTNSILWQNGSEIGGNIAQITVTYSDVEGGFSGPGNINLDPEFVDPDGWDNDGSTWEDNDFHIKYTSPCREAGTPTAPGIQPRDYDGNPRIEGIVDMGADEFYDHFYIVGFFVPGGEYKLMIIGAPGESFNGSILGSDVREDPVFTQYGWFYMQPPFFLFPIGLSFGGDGFIAIPPTAPGEFPTMPPSYKLPIQSVVEQNLTKHIFVPVEN